MKRYAAEFLGTFALVFCGTGAIVIDAQSGGQITHLGVALCFGLVVMIMIQALGPVSGAHLNPVVTLVFLLLRRMAGRDAIYYIIAQLAGALAASGVLRLLFPADATLGASLPSGSEMQSAVFEFMLTALLLLVILQLATGSKEQGLMAGMAIGGTVALEALFAGPVCGASMNPARSIAPALVSGHTEHLWIYLVAPLCGGACALIIHKFIYINKK